MNTSRRQFLQTAATAATALGLQADPLGLPIGCQTWPVRDALAKDFDGTLKQLAGMGYKRIEMCSPPGYAKGGYGPLVGIKASEMRDRIHAAGLGCESCHYQFRELKENLDDRIAFAKELGLKQMVLSTFGLPKTATMSDWSQAAHDLNKIGEQIQKAGLQAGFHNHNFEFNEIDGVLIYDKLMGEFDPKLIKMQFQVSVIDHGYEAATYFKKYPGRFLSVHLQDWDPAGKKQVAVGKGIVNWKKTFDAAKTGGIKNYFVELAMDDLQPSEQYLKALKV
jgi:sugar phosphate isomerase/epimerase